MILSNVLLKKYVRAMPVTVFNKKEYLSILKIYHLYDSCSHSIFFFLDFICLQESPESDYVFSDEYTCLGATESHSGYVQLFVRNNMLNSCHNIKVLSSFAVCATVCLENSSNPACPESFGISSIHLKPYPKNASGRLIQMDDIMHHFGAMPSLIIGDANMQDEDAILFLEKYQTRQIIDVHTRLNGARPYIWNLEINKYFKNAPPDKFNFDRIFTIGSCWDPVLCDVRTNIPVKGISGHFLSDHFALFSKINFSA